MSTVRLKGFKESHRVEEALQKLFKELKPPALESEIVDLDQALSRILADEVIADTDLPSFDKSAMDGFAVLADNTFGASQSNPILLEVVGEADMGKTPSAKVSAGRAVAIATGAPVPEGANAVVMLEFVKKLDAKEIEVCRPVTPGDNIIKVGDDVRKGERILVKGTRLKPHDIGMLTALGLTEVRVFKPPKVGIISTGNELVDAGTVPDPARVIDVNRPTLSAMIRELGGAPVDFGIVEDDPDHIRDRLRTALSESDLLLISAGTSVGKRDLVPDAINSLGKPGMLVHGVSIRPGLPTGLASVDGKPIFSLPGYPLTAIIGFQLFVRPVMSWMMNAREDPQPTVRAKASRRMPAAQGLRTFVRVIVRRGSDGFTAEPLRASGSGILSSLIRANGIVVIPEEKEGIESGEDVEVIMYRPVEEA